ncbi:hypothetical protein QQS21_000054 [Conoideocrella luteorostrata]|uniref:Uncharacterized protein n=1 Tax=Conoideocrella luteorostrata TaxID=1105319 RepID=A0AAJ0D1P3_9HYPO|nr:hypothetical protein QQS21_000054 [Conoideocrella luteorostrata]
MDDFDRQLKQKLETLVDDLLDDDQGEGLAEPYTMTNHGDRSLGDEYDGRGISSVLKDHLNFSEPNSSNLPSQRTENGAAPKANVKGKKG